LRICELAYVHLIDTKATRYTLANISTIEGENLYDLMTMPDAHTLALRLKYSGLKEVAVS